MSRARRAWLVFAACNVVVALALVWTTRVVLDLERSELRARAESEYQESIRLAMWRMDSWLALLLAREAVLPEFADGPGHTEATDYVQLRFEVDGAGGAVSPPQAPPEQAHPLLTLRSIRAALEQADAQVTTKLAPPIDPAPAVTEVDRARAPQYAQVTRPPSTQALKNQLEFDARVACSVPRPPGSELTDRQVVVWLDAPAPGTDSALAFLRRSRGGQGFAGAVLDWPLIEARLLFEIRDLFPQARLERGSPGRAQVDPLGRSLANIPVTLVTDPPVPIRAEGLSAGRAALGVAWLAALVAAVAVGATLQSSIDLGERRRRFVSAVTHELRTPLTTFQLYSEMLADGMIENEADRQQYLETLKEESQRLSAMVGNVLHHARLEEGRAPRRLVTIGLGELLARLQPGLERRLVSSRLTLDVQVESPPATSLAVDPEAIGQILGNLIDNAAKYAAGSSPATIRLGVATQDAFLTLTVRDHGPGVPRDQVQAIFAPFDRGGRDPSDPVPGVGLGLALARRLARDMGGDLTLERVDGGGALFRLQLPTGPGRAA